MKANLIFIYHIPALFKLKNGYFAVYSWREFLEYELFR